MNIDRDEVILKLINELEKSNKNIIQLSNIQVKNSETISQIINSFNTLNYEFTNLKKKHNLFRHEIIRNKMLNEQLDVGFTPQVFIKPSKR